MARADYDDRIVSIAEHICDTWMNAMFAMRSGSHIAVTSMHPNASERIVIEAWCDLDSDRMFYSVSSEQKHFDGREPEYVHDEPVSLQEVVGVLDRIIGNKR